MIHNYDKNLETRLKVYDKHVLTLLYALHIDHTKHVSIVLTYEQNI